MERRPNRPPPWALTTLNPADVERLRRAINSSTEGLWEWDVPTGMVWFSPKAETLLGEGGSPPPSWDSLRRLLHPDDVPALDAALADAAASGELDVSFRLRTADGPTRNSHGDSLPASSWRSNSASISSVNATTPSSNRSLPIVSVSSPSPWRWR